MPLFVFLFLSTSGNGVDSCPIYPQTPFLLQQYSLIFLVQSRFVYRCCGLFPSGPVPASFSVGPVVSGLFYLGLLGLNRFAWIWKSNICHVPLPAHCDLEPPSSPSVNRTCGFMFGFFAQQGGPFLPLSSRV